MVGVWIMDVEPSMGRALCWRYFENESIVVLLSLSSSLWVLQVSTGVFIACSQARRRYLGRVRRSAPVSSSLHVLMIYLSFRNIHSFLSRHRYGTYYDSLYLVHISSYPDADLFHH